MGRLLGIYLNFLKTKPYIAQSTTAGVLWLAGESTLADPIYQTCTRSRRPHPSRTICVHSPDDYVLTQCGSMSAGDTLAQRIEHGSFSKISGRRLLIFTSFGTFVAGPVMATWYRSLDRMTQPWLTREINKLSSRLKTPDGHKIKGEEAAKKKYAGDVGRLKLRATLFKTTLDMLVLLSRYRWCHTN